MSEALQKLILDTLDLHGSIPDTRALVLPGQTQSASTSEEQIIILGTLNSLQSREVNLFI
jgi:phenylalanyl-tRNA synthetase alpha chain